MSRKTTRVRKTTVFQTRAGQLCAVLTFVFTVVLPVVCGLPLAHANTSSWLEGMFGPKGSKQAVHSPKGTKSDPAYAAFEEGHYLTALKEAEIAAKRGDAAAYTLIGVIYQDGLGVAPDFYKAADSYRNAAKRGDNNGKVGLGLLLAMGKGVGRDIPHAAKLLEQAAKSGHMGAQYNLALLLVRGVKGISSPEQAAYWLLKAAGQGHIRAQYDLGTLYAVGKGVAKNEIKAAKWIGDAAAAGDPQAMLDYAMILFKGRGVTKNRPLSVDYFKRAAEKGNVVAQNRLARLYAFGALHNGFVLVERDYVKAAKWHLIARRRGLSDARLDLFLASLRKKERQSADQAVALWWEKNVPN